MKKLLLVCCIALGVSTLSKAQGGGGFTPPTPEAQTATLKAAVALTDAQEAKVLAIYKAQVVRTDSLTKATPDRQAARPTSMLIRTETTAKIKALLTPDQLAKYPAGRGGGRGAGGGGGGGGTPPPPTR